MSDSSCSIQDYFTKQDLKTGLRGLMERPEGLFSTKDQVYYQVNEKLSFSDAYQFIMGLFEVSQKTRVYPTIACIIVNLDVEHKIHLTLEGAEEKEWEDQECANQIRMIIKEITKRNMPPLIAQKLQKLTEDKTVKKIEDLKNNFANIVSIFHDANKDFAEILIRYGSLLSKLSQNEGGISVITEKLNIDDNLTLTNRNLIATYQELLKQSKAIHKEIKKENKDFIISLKTANLVIKNYEEWIKKVLPLTDVEHYQQQVAVTMSWWKKQRYNIKNFMADVADIFKRDNKNKETADYSFRILYCKAYELGQQRDLSQDKLKNFKDEIKDKSDKFLIKRSPL